MAETTTPSKGKSPAFRIPSGLKESLLGYLLISPAMLVISLFGLFPIFYSVYMSAFNWRVKKGDFVELDNYKKLFGEPKGLVVFFAGLVLLGLAFWLWNSAFKTSGNGKRVLKIIAALLLLSFGVAYAVSWNSFTTTGDGAFFKSLNVTLYYSLLTVPTQLIIGLVLAFILFQKIKGKEIFRMFYFLPYITPAVSTAIVFRTIFNKRDSSLSNIILGMLNIDPLKWLYEPNQVLDLITGGNFEGFWAGPSLALVTIAIYGVWTFAGYNTVIYLAGLGNIPTEVYEAAEIDGSNGWHLFWHITFPLISPVSFYLLLISFIGTFKAFNHLYVMKTPFALDSIDTASLTIFETFYKANNYGYAATQAIILFIIIAGLTFAQNKLLGKKVFYG